MAIMHCAVCGKNEIKKVGEEFICASCGCKYSLNEVRKLIGTDEQIPDSSSGKTADTEAISPQPLSTDSGQKDDMESQAIKKEQSKTSKATRNLTILSLIFALVAGIAVLCAFVFIPLIKYNFAIKLYNTGKLQEAKAAFYSVIKFKDSRSYFDSIISDPDKISFNDKTADCQYEYDNASNKIKCTLYFSDHESVEYKYAYNSDGKITQRNVSNNYESKTDTIEYSYVLDGKISKETITSIDNRVSNIYYEYNRSGQLTKRNTSVGSSEYFYDSNGYLIQERHHTYISPTLQGNSITRYEYDRDGNIIKEIATDKEYTYKYEFDILGNKTKEVVFTSDNIISKITEYIYDIYNNLAHCEISLFYDGKRYSTCKIDYDNKGNIIRTVEIDEDGVEKITRYENVYNSDGTLNTATRYSQKNEKTTYSYRYISGVIYETTLDSNGNKSESFYCRETQYDNNGNIILETDTYSTGEKSTREYEYDSNGNNIKQTYTHNGKVYIYEFSNFQYHVVNK